MVDCVMRSISFRRTFYALENLGYYVFISTGDYEGLPLTKNRKQTQQKQYIRHDQLRQTFSTDLNELFWRHDGGEGRFLSANDYF